MNRPLGTDPREIGFNHSVTVHGRVLHVQTEVLRRDELLIRTTVLEGGVVRVAERQVCLEETTELEQLRALAEEQHFRNVQELTESVDDGAH